MSPVCREEGLEGIDSTDPRITRRIFRTQTAAERYLLSTGYHRTSSYATFGYSTGNRDFTKDLNDGNRFQAWITRTENGFVIGSEGPEPNPEFNIAGTARGMWPVRAFKWHRRC